MAMEMAKQLKVLNLKPQRAFLEKKISMKSEGPQDDGEPSILYLGHIFPENRKFLEKEGFTIFEGKSEIGIPVNVITVSDEIELSADEQEEAESINSESAEPKKQEFPCGAGPFGGHRSISVHGPFSVSDLLSASSPFGGPGPFSEMVGIGDIVKAISDILQNG